MNTQKSVYNKLSKIQNESNKIEHQEAEVKQELSAEKVELAVVQDLVFAAKTTKATIEAGVDFLKKADPLVQAASNKLNDYNMWIDITLKEFAKVRQDAKDLGVSTSDIKEYKEAEDWLSKAKQLKSTFDSFAKLIKANR